MRYIVSMGNIRVVVASLEHAYIVKDAFELTADSYEKKEYAIKIREETPHERYLDQMSHA